MERDQALSVSKQRRVTVAAVSFFGLILWAIYLANTGSDNLILSIPKLIPHGDKVGHVVLFGCLTFLVNLSLRLRSPDVQGLGAYWGTFAVLSFVSAEELSQGLIESRTLDYQDFVANLVGICVGTWLSRKATTSPNRAAAKPQTLVLSPLRGRKVASYRPVDEKADGYRQKRFHDGRENPSKGS